MNVRIIRDGWEGETVGDQTLDFYSWEETYEEKRAQRCTIDHTAQEAVTQDLIKEQMIRKRQTGFIHLFTPRTASNGRFMDRLRHRSRNKPEINSGDRSQTGQDRDKPIYHKCSLNIPKSSVWFGGGALLNPGVTQKCAGCLLPSSHGNMEVALSFISPFWNEFVRNCFLRKMYSKSIHPPPDLTTVTPAPFRIPLNRTLDFSLAHKLWKHQK